MLSTVSSIKVVYIVTQKLEKLRKCMRIFHVVGALVHGGIETWLIQVLQHIDTEQFKMDFVVHTEEPAEYDDIARTYNARIIPCMHPSQSLRYAWNFLRILREYGPYDVAHSHVHHYSGYILMLARLGGVPIRIAHSHNDSTIEKNQANMRRKLYFELMENSMRFNATCGLAASKIAANSLFGNDWHDQETRQVLHCGIDLTRFEVTSDKAVVRAELGISPDAFIIGHVGRFVPQKNHHFLLKIAEALIHRDSNTHLILIGDGPLRTEIELLAQELKIQNHVHFLGLRDDVPRLMMSAMDLLLMPSLHEGLPITGLEGQAAGLPILFSDNVTREAEAVPGLVRWMSLDESADRWAEEILQLRTENQHTKQNDVLQTLSDSSFNVVNSAKNLLEIYGGSRG